VANPTVVATAQPANVPPRVKVDITDTGTPAVTSVTVTRTDSYGNVSTVRTSDGNPLTLVTSGSNRVGTVYDYEMPLGAAVTYSTVQNPASTASAQVDSSVSWLVHVGVPALSITIRIKELSTRTRKVSRGVFQPIGRRNAVVVTDGARKGNEGTLSLLTLTMPERLDLDEILNDSSVLLLNVPQSNGWGVDSQYISIGDVDEVRVTPFLGEAARVWTLPFIQVDSPIGGSQAQFTWTDVIAKYSTWTALIAANPTWADVLDPTT
jgi:hypothetical protein